MGKRTSPVHRFLQTKDCETKVACDGNTLIGPKALETKTCKPCQDKLAQRALAKARAHKLTKKEEE